MPETNAYNAVYNSNDTGDNNADNAFLNHRAFDGVDFDFCIYIVIRHFILLRNLYFYISMGF